VLTIPFSAGSNTGSTIPLPPFSTSVACNWAAFTCTLSSIRKLRTRHAILTEDHSPWLYLCRLFALRFALVVTCCSCYSAVSLCAAGLSRTPCLRLILQGRDGSYVTTVLKVMFSEQVVHCLNARCVGLDSKVFCGFSDPRHYSYVTTVVACYSHVGGGALQAY
jgi:hypothetical protein